MLFLCRINLYSHHINSEHNGYLVIIGLYDISVLASLLESKWNFGDKRMSSDVSHECLMTAPRMSSDVSHYEKSINDLHPWIFPLIA